MTFSLLGTARTNGTDTASTRTTDDAVGFRDTTGAKLMVVAFHGNLGATTSVADNAGNTYTMLDLGASSENRNRLYYCINPTTRPDHSWNVSGSSMFGFITVSYWGNTADVVGVDVSNSASGSGSTRATGSVTPGWSESLLIAVGVTAGAGSSFAINGGFTIGADNSRGLESGLNYGGAQAYLIQTAIAAANPTWTFPGSGNNAAGIVVFRGSDGVPAGGDTTPPTLSSPSGTGGLGVCSGSVSTNEGNGTLFAVATASATAPTALQVRNGQDHTGSGAGALRVVGPQAVTSTGTQSIASGAISGGAGTRFWHFMHEDAAGNRSAVVSSAGFNVTAPLSITTDPLRDQNNTLLASTTLTRAYAIRISDHTLVANWAAPVTNPSGVLSLSNAALTATPHLLVTYTAAGLLAGAQVYTPA